MDSCGGRNSDELNLTANEAARAVRAARRPVLLTFGAALQRGRRARGAFASQADED